MTGPDQQQPRTTSECASFALKCVATLLLVSLSVVVMACESSNTTSADLEAPQVSVTFSFDNNASPIPAVAPYLCGAWTTNTTPAFNPGRQIPVYAHFVQNVNGNPVGVNGANAQATVEWADGGSDTATGTTGSDGLVVFYFTIPNRPDIVNKNNLVTVSFTGPNGQTCNVDNQPQPAAYFTLLPGPSPTPQTAIPNIQNITSPFLDFLRSLH
jgi:hypothetical protein